MESASDHQALYGNCIAEEGEEIIDCAFDLGKVHLAAVNADGNVSIFQRANRQDNWTKVQTLETSGSGNFCKVCWAHPVNGLLIALGSTQGQISIWKQVCDFRQSMSGDVKPRMRQAGEAHVSGRVVAIEFAPKEKGLRLAAASTSQVSVFKPSPRGDDSWQLENHVDQSISTAFNCLCWQACATQLPLMLLVGSQDEAKLWTYRQERMSWHCAITLHSADISSVAWANSINRPQELVAVSCGKRVYIKGLSQSADQPKVEEIALLDHAASVTKIGWHPVAAWLAVSLKCSEVHLWRPNLVGEWQLFHRFVGTAAKDMES